MNETLNPRLIGARMSQVSLSPESLREWSQERNEPTWLTEARLAALATYARLPAPRYLRTDLRGVDIEGLALRALNGPVPAPRLAGTAPKGVLTMDLVEAARSHESLVRPSLEKLGEGATKWDALLAAAWTTGTFVFVEKGVETTDVLQLGTTLPPTGALIRDVIVLDPRARATLVDRWQGGADTDAEPALALASLDITPREGANLQINELQELAPRTTLLATRRARVGRDSTLTWIDGQFGSEKTVAVNETLLMEPGAKINFLGAFFGGEGQHFDITTSAIHNAKHTSSQLDMKGALARHGYAANYSIVFISENAPNSSGHQHQETLIVGEGARADAIPKLDVENNDVSASHGASVGQVDPDQVFYLKARGLTEMQAKRLIVEGFFEPLLKEIPFEDIREELARAIVRRVQ